MSLDGCSKTALFDNHVKHGGRVVDFAGWALPVQYSSMIQEHNAVRQEAGLFDCSHMGQFFVTGKDAYAFTQHMISNNLDKVGVGRGLYSGLLYENGTFVDDIIVYVIAKEEIFIVVNAANIEKDYAWFTEQLAKTDFDCVVDNRSDEYSLLALQGPKAPEALEKFFPEIYADMPTFGQAPIEYNGVSGIVCRSGYTGEAGVEIIIKNEAAPALFDAIIDSGVTPCGLGSRDSLRLEKGFSLYGHEITDQTNAIEAGLGWVSDLTKESFIGKDALVAVKEAGTTRKLVGFKASTRPIPREGDKFVDAEGNEIGFVTSGSMSPILNCGIGLGYLSKTHQGATVSIQTKRKLMEVELCKRTFV